MGMTIALVGNPNCGKTTLFNHLTGSKQSVGNWPGVTVAKKSGQMRTERGEATVVDLPGIYSLSTYTLEEVVTREFIESGEADVVINIVDVTNLERNLFLSLQLMEMGRPMVVALNMMDVLEGRGDSLDVSSLSRELGVPVVPIIASKGQGLDNLVKAAVEQKDKPPLFKRIYSAKTMQLIERLEKEMKINVCGKMHAIRFIEEGGAALIGHGATSMQVAAWDDMVEKVLAGGLERDMVIADEKYRYLTKVRDKCLTRAKEEKNSVSQKIDDIVTNRVLALPLFLIVMFAVFWLAFGPAGTWLKDGFSSFLANVVIGSIADFMRSAGVSDFVYSLIIDGILGGVGSVLSFLPEIAILFLALSFLEDSGYMSRAAFIMDRPLRRFGLSGKSFIPMILGFGCSVPAIMSARCLENEKERRLTMMVTPFISCSARLPVYAIMAGTFFAARQSYIVFSLYLLGIIIALGSACFLRPFVAGNRFSNFIMELPDYRLPTMRNMVMHTWEKVKGFIIRAGTLLVLACIIIWFLENFDTSLHRVEFGSDSILAAFGTWIAPVFKPLGFGEWRAVVSVLTGLAAKEAVVSTMGVLYGLGNAVLENPAMLYAPLSAVFTPISAYSFMVFVLLYCPCVATVAILRREMGSWKWTLAAIGYQTATAWIVAMLVYQMGSRLLGLA